MHLLIRSPITRHKTYRITISDSGFLDDGNKVTCFTELPHFSLTLQSQHICEIAPHQWHYLSISSQSIDLHVLRVCDLTMRMSILLSVPLLLLPCLLPCCLTQEEPLTYDQIILTSRCRARCVNTVSKKSLKDGPKGSKKRCSKFLLKYLLSCLSIHAFKLLVL